MNNTSENIQTSLRTNLPDNVILVDNVNQFKNRLDKHWMILYLIIAPTLLKPEVWHELIRIVKSKCFK